jgi:hypothetical protein
VSQQPAAQKRNVKVDWRALLSDIKARIPDSILANRHGLNARQIQSAKSKLVEKGLLDSAFLSQPWVCPKCQFHASEQPAECPRCGLIPHKLPRTSTRSEPTHETGTPLVCPKCGHRCVSESNFCATCGTQLRAPGRTLEKLVPPEYHSGQRGKQEVAEQGFTSLSSQPGRCPECGYEVIEQSRNCPKCGFVLALLPFEGENPAGAREPAPTVTDSLPWLYVAVNYVLLVISPMLYESSFYPVIWLLTLAAPLILFHDKTKLDEAGLNTKKLRLWWLFFSPVYLRRRAKLVDGSLLPYYLTLLLFLLSAIIAVLMLGFVLSLPL